MAKTKKKQAAKASKKIKRGQVHPAITGITSTDHKTVPMEVCKIDHDAPDTPPRNFCRICNPSEADKAKAERKAIAEASAAVVPDPDQTYRIINSVRHINVQLNDELPRIGTGMRPLLMWQTHSAKHIVTTHLYYVTRLVHEKLNERRWSDIQKCRLTYSEDGKWNPDGIANALEANLGKAVQWGWQVSQKNAQLVIAMLRTGKKPEELDLEEDAALSGSPEEEGAPKRYKVKEKAAKPPKEPKAPKVKVERTDLPEGSIKLLKEGNPRREGTKAGNRYADMAKYVGDHPKATVQEVLAKTSYRIDDFNWDRNAKNIEVVTK